MKIINQRSNDDCVLACIAMTAGVSYEKAKEVLTELKLECPLSTESAALILVKLGCWLDLQSPFCLFKSQTYIITVPSLNFPGLNHAIVGVTDKDGFLDVYDPQNGIEGKKYYKKDDKVHWTYAERVVKLKEI